MNDKNRIRMKIKSVLAGISPDRAAKAGKDAADILRRQREFVDARSVMIFLPLPGEIDTREIARAAWAAGKRVAAPRIRAPGVMDAVEIRSLNNGLEPGVMNILEPVDNGIMAVGELDLIVAPALAFDRSGNRLGRGGGFYDRFISQNRGTLVCGLAFDLQLIDKVPAREHDRAVNMLATNTEFLRFGREQ